jgi:hypothetical protein
VPAADRRATVGDNGGDTTPADTFSTALGGAAAGAGDEPN